MSAYSSAQRPPRAVHVEATMLQPLGPGPSNTERERYVPGVVAPLLAAADADTPLEPVVAALVRSLGFDSFMYGTSLTPRPGQEAICYVFTTLPREWVARYDQRAYIEVDPRVRYPLDNAIPMIWDQTSERGRSAATDAFLDDAMAHGIASGVVFAIHSAARGYVLVFFNSKSPHIDDVRRFEIMRNMGDLLLLGIYFHELFMKTVVERGLPPRIAGAPLSSREKQCLTLSAEGETSRQIATMLGISERTVELHFANARTKLGVANRQAAIAAAMDQGIIWRGEYIAPEPDESAASVATSLAAARQRRNRRVA